ncbi:hypothetical protein A9X06_04910 [Mycobacterium sp. 852002-51759_SCH5129042]|nr:hypothetical protein A9X06_04910 [Mycobacterium sp. 852002-51759_SCH5129042]
MTDDNHSPAQHTIRYGVQVPMALTPNERWVPALPRDHGHPLDHPLAPLDLYRLHGPDNTACQATCPDLEDCGDACNFARDNLAPVTGWALLCGLLDAIAAHSAADPAPAPQAGRWALSRVEVIHRPNWPVVTTFPIGRYDTLLAAHSALQNAENCFSQQHSGLPESGQGTAQSPRLWIEQISPTSVRHIRFNLTMAEPAPRAGAHR